MLVSRSVVGLVLGMASAAFATDYTWNGGSGSFQSDANWTPVGVPGSGDKALFTTAGSYGVSFAGAVQNASSTVGGDVTFGLNGYSWLLSGSLAFTGSGTAHVGGGTLEVGSRVTVANGQKLVLESGTGIFKSDRLETTTGGCIEVNGGSHTLSWAMPLGAAPSGGASLRMTGGLLSMTNNDNLARCTLGSGARIALEGGTLSIRYQVDMNGVPSSPGVIDIYTNATLLQNPGIGFNVSRTGGGLSIVNIQGGALLLSNSNFNAGNANSSLVTTGMLNLVDGVFVMGNMTLGYNSNAVAIVRQSGGVLRSTGTSYIGKHLNTLGIIEQSGGTSWHSQFYVGGYDGGTGEVSLSGGTLAIANSGDAIGKLAGSAGRMLQTGGDFVSSNSLTLGNASRAFGVYTNTGGTVWLNGTLYLGSSIGSLSTGGVGRAYFAGPTNYIRSGVLAGNNALDRGEFLVGGGSTVVDGAVTAGIAVGATGSVSVTGGELRCKGLTIGQAGEGSLFASGGVLAVTNGGTFAAGVATGATAWVEISGGTNLFLGQGLTFGDYGTARVRVSGGFTYTTNRVVIGHHDSSTGRLELVSGVFSAPIIDGRVGSQYVPPGGYSEVLFDGGTLQHSVDGESWMPGSFVNSFSAATLTDRGAVIDSNGGTIAIPQALSNETGFAGSFTKKGAGKLTLSSWANAFNGRIAVEEGELAATGALYLSGGVSTDAGALLNLAGSTAIRGTVTASGTVSRVDGALTLPAGLILTNGLGAAMGGSGVVTGGVVFASGSVVARDRTASPAGALRVTETASLGSGVTVALTGYTVQDLWAGIPLVTCDALQVQGKYPVTLDGASHPYWWTTVSSDGRTLIARVTPLGTAIFVH